MGLAPGLSFFITARFVAGIGVGMASMLSPMYIAEIAPQHMRGRMVAINQLTIVFGQVITHSQNFLLREQGPEAWRWMFGLGMVPSILFLLGVIFLPESPRWLMKSGNEKEAGKVLSRIGDGTYSKLTIQAIRETLHKSENTGYAQLFSNSAA
jgi:MFS family permease